MTVVKTSDPSGRPTDPPTPPANEAELVDKHGRKLRGNARKMAELKRRDGKGPRPGAARRDRDGDIGSSRTSPKPKRGGLLGALERIW